jgi:FG-GAP-like repeat
MKKMLYILTATLVACGAGQPKSDVTARTQGDDTPPVDCRRQIPNSNDFTPGSFDLDPLEMNGNRRNDISVYRPSNRYWYWQNEDTQLNGVPWGQSGDFMMPQDYNGDGLSDLAVFRPSVGTWYILESKKRWTTWTWDERGEIGDQPVAADYDADCKADIATWTPETGLWRVYPSQTPRQTLEYTLGSSSDTPVADDYDGDFKSDPAVYQGGVWHIILISTGQKLERAIEIETGLPTDQPPGRGNVPVQMNYDGDEKGVDIATFDRGTGIWRIAPTTGAAYRLKFGTRGDLPAPGFYSGQINSETGNPKADIAVFRAGTWYIQGHHNIPYCSLGYLEGTEPTEETKATICHFGLPGDLPIKRQLMPDVLPVPEETETR